MLLCFGYQSACTTGCHRRFPWELCLLGGPMAIVSVLFFMPDAASQTQVWCRALGLTCDGRAACVTAVGAFSGMHVVVLVCLNCWNKTPTVASSSGGWKFKVRQQLTQVRRRACSGGSLPRVLGQWEGGWGWSLFTGPLVSFLV